jgi:hypothetical protein
VRRHTGKSALEFNVLAVQTSMFVEPGMTTRPRWGARVGVLSG